MSIICGRVEKGRGLGRELGFPTVNLAYGGDERGVFAAEVWVDNVKYKGAAHVGPKPTLGDEKPICEVFLLDYVGGDLGEKELEVVLVGKVREVMKFEDLAALKEQIARDVVEIENLLR